MENDFFSRGHLRRPLFLAISMFDNSFEKNKKILLDFLLDRASCLTSESRIGSDLLILLRVYILIAIKATRFLSEFHTLNLNIS